MGIRFNCPSGHKLNVKEFLAGKRGVCPQCGAKFIIPTLAEAADIESPLSAPNGLSQSIEIAVAPAPGRQAAAASASPSVIIPTVDADIELATPELELPPAILGPPQIPVADALPASIVAVTSPTVAAPIQVPPEAVIPSQRERSRRNQIVISLLLLALVLVLAGVLIWVLKRDANQTPVEEKKAVGEGELQQVFAMTGFNFLSTLHPRDGALDL